MSGNIERLEVTNSNIKKAGNLRALIVHEINSVNLNI